MLCLSEPNQGETDARSCLQSVRFLAMSTAALGPKPTVGWPESGHCIQLPLAEKERSACFVVYVDVGGAFAEIGPLNGPFATLSYNDL